MNACKLLLSEDNSVAGHSHCSCITQISCKKWKKKRAEEREQGRKGERKDKGRKEGEKGGKEGKEGRKRKKEGRKIEREKRRKN